MLKPPIGECPASKIEGQHFDRSDLETIVGLRSIEFAEKFLAGHVLCRVREGAH